LGFIHSLFDAPSLGNTTANSSFVILTPPLAGEESQKPFAFDQGNSAPSKIEA